jgi:hypothetical protein
LLFEGTALKIVDAGKAQLIRSDTPIGTVKRWHCDRDVSMTGQEYQALSLFAELSRLFIVQSCVGSFVSCHKLRALLLHDIIFRM